MNNPLKKHHNDDKFSAIPYRNGQLSPIDDNYHEMIISITKKHKQLRIYRIIEATLIIITILLILALIYLTNY